jgi:cobalamin biosynthesis protein CbiG|tara:strand:- start:13572 stop:13742 length:171 start_codon:yes stop_codon:yes gene_type:complete
MTTLEKIRSLVDEALDDDNLSVNSVDAIESIDELLDNAKVKHVFGGTWDGGDGDHD